MKNPYEILYESSEACIKKMRSVSITESDLVSELYSLVNELENGSKESVVSAKKDVEIAEKKLEIELIK